MMSNVKMKRKTTMEEEPEDIAKIFCTYLDANSSSSARARAAREVLINNVDQLQQLVSASIEKNLRNKVKISFNDLFPNFTACQKDMFLKRYKKKMKKLLLLSDKISYNDESTLYSLDFLDKNRVFFKTYINDPELDHLERSSASNNNVFVNVYHVLKTEVDTVSGSFSYLSNNPFVPVYILVPRKDSLNNCALSSKKDVASLHRILTEQKIVISTTTATGAARTSKPTTYRRGKKREALSTTYMFLGVTVPQGGQGLTLRHPEREEDKQQLNKMLKRVQHLARMWLPFGLTTILKFMKQEVGDTASFFSLEYIEENYWASIAFSSNIITPGHIDKDGFLGCITVSFHPEDKDDEEHQYMMDDAIALFFCLPTLGIRIALRPGDTIFFNPRVPHCVSQRTKAYENERVYVTSFYMKIEQLSKHNNSIPFDNVPSTGKKQKKTKHEMINNDVIILDNMFYDEFELELDNVF